jgi:hypothetical protein
MIMKTDITVSIRGMDFPVSVTNRGMFTAEYDGQELRGDTLETLKVLLTKATKVRLDIPFARYDENWDSPSYARHGGPRPMIRKGRLTGIHAGNDSLMVVWAGSSGAEQVPYFREGVMAPLSTEDENDLRVLAAAKHEADTKLHQFLSARKIDLREQAQKAIAGDES